MAKCDGCGKECQKRFTPQETGPYCDYCFSVVTRPDMGTDSILDCLARVRDKLMAMDEGAQP